MPKIIVQANDSRSNPGLVTLSERIIAENLTDHHYPAQLIERLNWATADAEALEQSAGARRFDRGSWWAAVPVARCSAPRRRVPWVGVEQCERTAGCGIDSTSAKSEEGPCG